MGACHWIARKLGPTLKFGLLMAFAVPAAAADPLYEVEITGVEGEAEAIVRQVSVLVQRAADEVPPPPIILQRRAEQDETEVRRALEAIGYWSAAVTARVEPGPPAKAVIAVTPGPRYTVADYAVSEPGGAAPTGPIDRAALGMAPEAPAAGAAIVAAEEKLKALYAAKGYPLAATRDRKVVVDHAARVARVSVTVVPGPPVRIGRVTVSGLEQVQEPFVRRRLAFKEGDPLTSTSIDAARQALVESGLFRTVRISYPREDLTATVLPVTVEVAERPHRSIGVGLGYSTNTGALAKVFWEHRNLFNEGERLRATGQLGQKDSLLELSFREPDFLRTDQALLASLKAQDEETDAYDRKSYGGSLAVERKLWDNWKGSLGVSYEHAFVTRHDIDTEEDLLGLPVTLSRDTTDNLLDPTRGSRLRLTATPYAPIGQQKTAFLVLSARHTFYQSLDEAGDIVGAGWVGLGSIPGADLADIPLSRRFYAGGGGSVRGFAYQHAGPLDRFNDPTGGSSLFEFGGEVRFKVTETIGIVPFLEAGSVYDDALPKFGQKLFWGAGIGVRYYTPIGPLRLDIATPLNPRRDDAKVQFYVSLGQAF